jgi:hypothetical protein
VHAVRQLLQIGAEAGVDEDDPVAGAGQEAADRQPGHPVAAEELRAHLWCHIAPEVTWPRRERAIGNGVQSQVPDPHPAPPLQMIA